MTNHLSHLGEMLEHILNPPVGGTSHRRGVSSIGAVLLIVSLVAAFFPISVNGLVREYYSEKAVEHKCILKKTIDCNLKIGNGKDKDWSFTSLGSNLTLIIEISSTEVIKLKIETIDGKIIDDNNKIFHYNKTIHGPSIVVTISNSWEIFGERAELTGYIKIFHEYDEVVEIQKYRLIPGKIWKIWWIPFLFR